MYIYIICILHIRHVYYTYIYIYILSPSSSPHCLPFYDWGTCCFPFINLWFAPTWHQPGTRTPVLHRHLRIFAGPSVKPSDFVCFWLQGLPWISWGKKRNIHGFNIKLWSYQRADLVRTYGFITIDSNHGQEIRLGFFLGPNQKDQNSPIDVKEVQRLKQARSRTMSDLSLSAVAFHLSIRP